MGRKRKTGDQLDGLLGIQGSLASGHQEAPNSRLVDLLVNKYLWGGLPETLLQQICAAAVQDGLENPQVKRIAQAGTEGIHSGP